MSEMVCCICGETKDAKDVVRLKDGCLELDDEQQLFRVVNKDSHTANGCSSEFVFPYSAVKGYHYEMVYVIRETDYSEEKTEKQVSIRSIYLIPARFCRDFY